MRHARRCFARPDHKDALVAVQMICPARNEKSSRLEPHMLRNGPIGIGGRNTGVKDRSGILAQLF